MIVSHSDITNKVFDYVIIGGGTAGLVVAARLSEDHDVSVLVLEAGAANLGDVKILRGAVYDSLIGDPQYAWAHQSTKQQVLDGRVYGNPRGKGLGGTSSINFMSYAKPPAGDIDDWEKLGNPGWNWANLQRAAASVEGFVEPSDDFKERFSLGNESWSLGREGPLTLGFPGLVNDEENLLQQTVRNAGISKAPSPYSGDPNGYYSMVNNYDPRSYSRSYSVTAFYEPNKGRTNLAVVPHALVYMILTDTGSDGQLVATGVTFIHEGSSHVVKVGREVILCAGTLKTPQILELSGIGRKDILDRIGVPLKLELPGVGENVQEHLAAGLSWELRDDAVFRTLDALRDPRVAEKEAKLHQQGNGLYTMGTFSDAFGTLDRFTPKAAAIYDGLLKSVLGRSAEEYPPGLREQLVLQAERYKPQDGRPLCQVAFVPGFFSEPNPPEDGKRYISPQFILNSAMSRGTIHCVTNNPQDDPEIEANYFTNPVDLEVFTEGWKFMRALADVYPLRDMISREHNPGLSVKTDADLQNWLKESFHPACHTTSSCAMLPRDKIGVVAPDLRIYDTRNIRIADLSIVPLQISTHTQSIAYAIGARAAEIIKSEVSV